MKQWLIRCCLILAAVIFLLEISNAQLTVPPNGGNKKAWVGERIGITDVSIHYDRPGVKKREGQIWGKLIPVGFSYLGFGNAKEAPWRAGANENTTIEFSTDVSIEGQALPAGKYGFFIAYDPELSTLIFSKNSSSWGSFYYNPTEDVLRVKVKPQPLDKSVEWLNYSFIRQTENSATVSLQWEKLAIEFKVETDLNATQIASFRKELQSEKGFHWEAWADAAGWCLQHNTNLNQALLWADSACSETFEGDQQFQTWHLKGQILQKLGRSTEATAAIKRGLPFASMNELHQFGRDLISERKFDEAFGIFSMNYDRHPNKFTTNMGMARAYSALGKYKKALEFANAAFSQAPDPVSKDNAQKFVTDLKLNRDINL